MGVRPSASCKRLRTKTHPPGSSPKRRRTSKLPSAPSLPSVRVEHALVQTEDVLRRSLMGVNLRKMPKVGIVLCSRSCPVPRLREWLFWHLSLGVSIIFLRWEGPLDAGQRRLLEPLRLRGDVVLTRAPIGLDCAFNAVMTRQVAFVQKSMVIARRHGCSFLLHIDDDELICPFNPEDSIVDIFRRHVGSSKRCIHFENYEAVFKFERSTARPFSRAGTKFKTDCQVLYCNGKSAANLALLPNFASGVHHFCQHDRCFVAADPAFGLHDNDGGCTHADCCDVEAGAVILHFDSPSFAEWRVKFKARAESTLKQADCEEMDCFAFKKDSIRVLREKKKKAPASQRAEEKVYRRYRCLPAAGKIAWSSRLSGEDVEKRFKTQLEMHASRSGLIVD